MGARTWLIVSAMVLVFVFAAAPFIAHDEVANAMGIPVNGSGSYRISAPAFGDRDARIRVSMNHGRVMLEAELPDQETRSRLLTRAADLYGQDQFIDLVAVVPNLKAMPFRADVASILPTAGSMGPDSQIDLNGHTLTLHLNFSDSDKRDRYMGQLKALAAGGVELVDKSTVGVRVDGNSGGNNV